MQVTKTALDGVLIIEPKVFGDARGWFMETWSARKFEAAGLKFNFVQDNQSYSAHRGTLRGL
ncbi:MAG: dTDP-4-dehydrorhamnose 3,5-epimerase family protein, partial [Selenomonadaceae bacterium]|nr:dTDP-4-dehydrorhamnose 3,5-epimerase family protein [Selenomonadaceae bacterium]